jgi:hypothetical protein
MANTDYISYIRIKIIYSYSKANSQNKYNTLKQKPAVSFGLHIYKFRHNISFNHL